MSEYENGEPQEENEDDRLEDLGLTTQEYKFKLGGEVHVLRELTGMQRDRYLDEQQANLKVTKEGNVTGLKTFEGHMVKLIALGLYKKDEHGTFTKMVPEAVIRTFPASTQKKLYDRLQKMSGLDMKADDAAGNS